MAAAVEEVVRSFPSVKVAELVSQKPKEQKYSHHNLFTAKSKITQYVVWYVEVYFIILYSRYLDFN